MWTIDEVKHLDLNIKPTKKKKYVKMPKSSPLPLGIKYYYNDNLPESKPFNVRKRENEKYNEHPQDTAKFDLPAYTKIQ